MKLRDYQQGAIEALYAGWGQGGRRLAVVLPTGVGKTVIMTAIAADAARHGKRALILVHRDELAQQTLDKLRKVVPDSTSLGLVKAQHNEAHADIVVASIQTVQRLDRLREIWNGAVAPAVVIADEIHRSAAPMWVKVFEELGVFTATGPLMCGFTATMSRADARSLGDVWERVVYTRGIKWFIEQGHLVNVSGKAVTTNVDLDSIKKTAGDYNERELGLRMADETVRKAIVDAYSEHAADRQGVLFAPTVDSAEFFADGLNEAGFRTEGVYGTTPLLGDQGREGIYGRYRAGETQILTSCTALAEGWDAPWASCAVLARPTLHQGLFIQQVGRVLRPWPGKKDALVLDVAGATRQHSLHAMIELNETVKKDVDLREQEDLAFVEILEAIKYTGPVAFADVDLFAGTEAKWLTTSGGVLFIGLRDRLIFLNPVPGSEEWAVGEFLTPNRGGGWLFRGDSAAAMAWASDYALEQDPSTASKNASWRKGRRKPSEAQTEFAVKLGLDPTGMSKDEVSDAISIALASRTLRRFATKK